MLWLCACVDPSEVRRAGPGEQPSDHDDSTDTAPAPVDTAPDTATHPTDSGTETAPLDTAPDTALLPAPVASYHLIDRDDPFTWDAIRALSETWTPGPLINSQNRPKDLPAARWAQKISPSWYGSGADLAAAVEEALGSSDPPAIVLFDELNSGTEALVAEAATTLGTTHPEWAGRWGAWVVNGEAVEYSALASGIDALLGANAALVLELYATQSRYCASGTSAGDRDAWLAGFFRGNEQGFGDRLVWLMDRRTAQGSASHVSIAFGVTDTYMDGTSPSVFLDRMFYVWMTRSEYRSLALLPNGGVGAYKWDDPAMSNTSRDLAFSDSFTHYVVNGETSSRSGQVDCD